MAWRLSQRQRGDAIVEFILVVPILLLILFGILELGRVIDAWIVVQNAAREGARTGAQTASTIAAGPAAQQAASTYLNSAFSNRDDVDAKRVGTPVVSSDAVQVTAEADIHIYTPLMQSILSPAVPVRATAIMPR